MAKKKLPQKPAKRALTGADIQQVSDRLGEILGHMVPLNVPLDPQKCYGRVHDDHDGMYKGELQITVGPDGDMWISTDPPSTLRFRMPFIGGGMSPRVWNALRVLAFAIELDNRERPIQKPDKK